MGGGGTDGKSSAKAELRAKTRHGPCRAGRSWRKPRQSINTPPRVAAAVLRHYHSRQRNALRDNRFQRLGRQSVPALAVENIYHPGEPGFSRGEAGNSRTAGTLIRRIKLSIFRRAGTRIIPGRLRLRRE